METNSRTEVVDRIIAPNPEGIPNELKVRPQWIVWKGVSRDGTDKLDKVPYDPKTNRKASTTDLATWATFEEAMRAYELDDYHGVGFSFCSADPYIGADVDDCRDPETREISPEVVDYLRDHGFSYIEISISGKGIHGIGRGKIQGGARKGRYEIYDQDRFFAITGVRI